MARLAELWRARNLHAGIDLAKNALERWPDEGRLRVWQARFLFAAGSLMEAEMAARDALLLHAESETLWIILADCLIRRERQQDSVNTLAEACRILPGSLALLGRLGRQAQRLGSYQQAMIAFTAAAALEPEREIWSLQILNVLLAARRFALGRKMAQEASLKFPQSAAIFCSLSSFCRHERLHQESETAARRALEIDPLFSEAYHALFISLMVQRRSGEAFRILQSACSLLPQDRSLWILLGRQAVRHNVLDLAITAFERAVALPESPISAWAALIEALFAKKRYLDAATQAVRGLLAHSGDHSLATLLAEALLRQGTEVDALRRMLGETMGLPLESVAISHAIMEAMMKAGRSSEITELLVVEQREFTDLPKTQLLYARALMAMGAPDRAEQILKRLVDADPTWIAGLEALCDALRHQKKIQDALRVFRQIEELGPDGALMRELRYRMFGSSD